MSKKSNGANATKQQNAYIERTYDHINIITKKSENLKQIVKDHASARGESVNAFANRAFKETIERDNTRGDE